MRMLMIFARQKAAARLDDEIGKSTVDFNFNPILLAGLAVLSRILAAVGLFGILFYVVAQRTGEIGIRIALGAQRQDVFSGVAAILLSVAVIACPSSFVARIAPLPRAGTQN
jgi:putative ABC transport system permease protein